MEKIQKEIKIKDNTFRNDQLFDEKLSFSR